MSQRAFEAIIGWEVSDKRTYEQTLTRPTWPAVKSGVTIGIGYDLGYQTREQFVRDWSPHLSEDEVETLLPCVGVKGRAAEVLAQRVSHEVSIPWAAAISVYQDTTIPRWEATTLKAFRGADALPPDCFGALVSLVFNRGPDMGAIGADSWERRQEMRLIRDAITAKDYGDVPAALREMKRLWPESRGLRNRREAEAKMFETGLKEAGL
jgi:GH24 family phage-related lysozyme (muramidase)